VRVLRAKLAMSRNQFATARTELAAALAAARLDATQLTGLLVRAELNLDENRLDAALDDARRALALARKAQGGVPYSSRVGQAWLLLGRVLARQGNVAQARQAAQSAVDHLSNTVDPDHPLLKDARQLAT